MAKASSWHSRVLRFTSTQLCVRSKFGTAIASTVWPSSPLHTAKPGGREESGREVPGGRSQGGRSQEEEPGGGARRKSQGEEPGREEPGGRARGRSQEGREGGLSNFSLISLVPRPLSPAFVACSTKSGESLGTRLLSNAHMES